MKKVFFSVLVLALLLSSVGLGVATVRVPRAFCLNYFGFSDVVSMSIKPMGNVRMFDGRQKYYAIHGAHTAGFSYSMPIYGTAFVVGDLVHFAYTGSYWDGMGQVRFIVEGYWDTVLEDGVLNVEFGNTGTVTPFSIEEIPCADLVRPFGEGMPTLRSVFP
jgi:hypothetical protein